ncbi:hypothetical protein DFH11DRAFT_1589467 [Phellopilus nigrolimitatus]|nr:hypothetical protein DFH11DRAFT_1589467 [Phellopilus nigrolimitatus]
MTKIRSDFLPGGALAVPDGDAVLPAVRALLQREWAFVAASQDFHPPGHVSFASAHGKPLFSQLDVLNPFAAAASGAQLTTVHQMLWPDHCVRRAACLSRRTADAESQLPCSCVCRSRARTVPHSRRLSLPHSSRGLTRGQRER